MFNGIIYRATSPSKKMYYGMTLKTLDGRKSRHLKNTINGFTLPFNNAIRKYGIDNLKWKIIEEYSNVSKPNLISLLYEREIYWIAKDNTTNKEKGYNVSPGGAGSDIFSMLSPERQKEVRNTISTGLKKKWKNEEYRTKVVKSRNTKSYKDNQSENAKKQWKNLEIRDKSLKAFKEKIWNNPERNEKIKNSLKNQKKYKCPYCSVEYTKGNYNRWHGEKCKLK